MQVSVKVMKSYDYCHFEVQLGEDSELILYGDPGLKAADRLGKEAQKLVDKQIARYKRYKQHLEGMSPFGNYRVAQAVAHIRDKIPAAHRTPEMKALLKAVDDYNHWQGREFDYDEDFEPALTADDIETVLKQINQAVNDGVSF